MRHDSSVGADAIEQFLVTLAFVQSKDWGREANLPPRDEGETHQLVGQRSMCGLPARFQQIRDPSVTREPKIAVPWVVRTES